MGMCRPGPGIIQSFSYYNRQSSKNLKCPLKRMLYCIRKMKLWLFWEWQPWQEKIMAWISSYHPCNYSNSQAPWQIFDLKDNLKQTNTPEDDLIVARPNTVPIDSRCLIIQENLVEGFTNPSPRHWVETNGSESSWKCLWYMAWDN